MCRGWGGPGAPGHGGVAALESQLPDVPFPGRHGRGQQEIAGPALLCGAAFAWRLSAGGRVRKQEGPDFSLYYADAADGPFLIYEGNFPEPHDDEINTGLGFPALIAIHDNRSDDAKAHARVRDRLLTGNAFAEACPQRRSSE